MVNLLNFVVTKDDGPHRLPTLFESIPYPLIALGELKGSCG